MDLAERIATAVQAAERTIVPPVTEREHQLVMATVAAVLVTGDLEREAATTTT